jgi:hypothetical protein
MQTDLTGIAASEPATLHLPGRLVLDPQADKNSVLSVDSGNCRRSSLASAWGILTPVTLTPDLPERMDPLRRRPGDGFLDVMTIVKPVEVVVQPPPGPEIQPIARKKR